MSKYSIYFFNKNYFFTALQENGGVNCSIREGHDKPIDMKQILEDELRKMRDNAAKNSVFLAKTIYQKFINGVQKAKMITKKKPRWFMNYYDVVMWKSHLSC